MHALSRFLLPVLFLLPATAWALTIETAFTRHYGSDQIRPLVNYLVKALNDQRFRTVLPSRPTDPEGQYFILKLGEPESRPPAGARMTLYTTAGKEPGTWEWELSGSDLRKWLYLGLTGEDWPDEAVRPMAWRVELLDASGQVLAEWKSFLWEMP
jgi:hypothetical protein